MKSFQGHNPTEGKIFYYNPDLTARRSMIATNKQCSFSSATNVGEETSTVQSPPYALSSFKGDMYAPESPMSIARSSDTFRSIESVQRYSIQSSSHLDDNDKRHLIHNALQSSRMPKKSTDIDYIRQQIHLPKSREYPHFPQSRPYFRYESDDGNARSSFSHDYNRFPVSQQLYEPVGTDNRSVNHSEASVSSEDPHADARRMYSRRSNSVTSFSIGQNVPHDSRTEAMVRVPHQPFSDLQAPDYHQSSTPLSVLQRSRLVAHKPPTTPPLSRPHRRLQPHYNHPHYTPPRSHKLNHNLCTTPFLPLHQNPLSSLFNYGQTSKSKTSHKTLIPSNEPLLPSLPKDSSPSL